MSELKQLAGQTIWYGLSNVGAKLLNALLTPLLTYLMGSQTGMYNYGNVSLIYAYFGVMNVLFTYGMETGYFRFSNKKDIEQSKIFNTTFTSIIISSIIFCSILYYLKIPITQIIGLDNHTEYITLCIFILLFDTLSSIPFARLRQENRPKRYAFIKISGILTQIFFIVFFLYIAPQWTIHFPYFHNHTQVFFILLSNLIASFFVFIMLSPQWTNVKPSIDIALWKDIIRYSSPMIIIGLAGMINEVMDRQFLKYWYQGSNEERTAIVGIYSANYKISIVITMFIQAFKMAAEPFFFRKAENKNAPQLYAKVMHWFVITLSIAFLITALFLDIWQYYVQENYRIGLYIVPILLMANLFSGIYYNLSVWYKIKDKMMAGVVITLIGALLTFIGNYYFIPSFGMLASAWTTLICYAVMVVICYYWGQKVLPIPYRIAPIVLYLTAMIVTFATQEFIKSHTQHFITRFLTGAFLMLLYIAFIIYKERHFLQQIRSKK